MTTLRAASAHFVRSPDLRACATLLGLALAAALALLLSGCATVKATLIDPTTGGTWVIKERPLGPDEIYYCAQAPDRVYRCQPAQAGGG